MTMAKTTKMRGGLIQRGEDRWTAVITLGHSAPDPVTGKRRLLQKWVSLGKCTRQQAKIKRDEMLVAMRKAEFVEPTLITFGEWLSTWLDETIKPPARRPSTYASYKAIIGGHLIPGLGSIGLQALRPGHIAAYHRARRERLSGAALQVHHAIVSERACLPHASN